MLKARARPHAPSIHAAAHAGDHVGARCALVSRLSAVCRASHLPPRPLALAMAMAAPAVFHIVALSSLGP